MEKSGLVTALVSEVFVGTLKTNGTDVEVEFEEGSCNSLLLGSIDVVIAGPLSQSWSALSYSFPFPPFVF